MKEVCLFSLNIPLQILPSARSGRLWVSSLLSPPAKRCAWLTLNSKIPPFPHHPIVATLYINLLLILSTLLSHSIT